MDAHHTIWLAIGVLIIGRKWFEAEIEKRVEHKFSERLEKLRAELQAKASEIAALRDGVLSGRMQRQVDKRRLEAVERAWSSAVAISQLKMVSAVMAVFKFEETAKEAYENPRLRSTPLLPAPGCSIQLTNK